ncbi:MAG: transglycosylase domain-containing protein [Proteobacteria bacterium]|nr:transglycosylase domain-containing protein [Pseudomonadota bacterium]MBU1386818.1 transglycosylase domain-containing protein [Pseudomonadota bacterium]MBU1544762.1 transglycosylase domain-containing protein [Pseudomonadota bacterium]MBU2431099.1 transglycosylase domain-containing protein [Pseudomonadota bacterium]MBU2481566.1 transglycosylase domain-containing protein [Pseudomonadota bacterium]
MLNSSGRRILFFVFCLTGAAFFSWQTHKDLLPVPDSLNSMLGDAQKFQILDRNNTPLTVTYQNTWNIHEYIPLHEIPEQVQAIFIFSEDKRFFDHHGVDWRARIQALWQNISSLRAVRGASTISEQVIRMIHPRPRTLWSKWLEGIESARLEKKISKSEILEFYLNQVPYAANKRGISQAARYYFDRDIDTLSITEMLALAILVRAPSRMDLYKHPDRIYPSLNHLATALAKKNMLSAEQVSNILKAPLMLFEPKLPVHAAHFVQFMQDQNPQPQAHKNQQIKTTLDSDIQNLTQNILDNRICALKKRQVNNGAALVVDHTTNEILAWAVAGQDEKDTPDRSFDAVLSLRQPGSSMKPFLYAAAIEKGWTGATLIDDTPLTEPVGTGLHPYHNYSGSFYGPVSLRHALGNSLNIPAIRTIQFIGVENYLSQLFGMGFKSLVKHPDFYGPGLALGNGEVSLFEIVQAYTVLARHGNFIPLTGQAEHPVNHPSSQIFSQETTSIMGNILSDADARFLEFGTDSILNFPVQTAVKTGTSSDYNDAWAIGYNYKYTVGIWMGNLNGLPMDGVTGSIGPALVLRSIFSRLNQFEDTRPLYLSPRLVQKTICDPTFKTQDDACYKRDEWFIARTRAQDLSSEKTIPKNIIQLKQPAYGLRLAMDPRIPEDKQAFEFYIEGITEKQRVCWMIDNSPARTTLGGKLCWNLEKGDHLLTAMVLDGNTPVFETKPIPFYVK